MKKNLYILSALNYNSDGLNLCTCGISEPYAAFGWGIAYILEYPMVDLVFLVYLVNSVVQALHSRAE